MAILKQKYTFWGATEQILNMVQNNKDLIKTNNLVFYLKKSSDGWLNYWSLITDIKQS